MLMVKVWYDLSIDLLARDFSFGFEIFSPQASPVLDGVELLRRPHGIGRLRLRMRKAKETA